MDICSVTGGDFYYDHSYYESFEYSDTINIEYELHKISSLWTRDAVIGSVVCILLVFPIIIFITVLVFYQLRKYGKHSSEYHF